MCENVNVAGMVLSWIHYSPEQAHEPLLSSE